MKRSFVVLALAVPLTLNAGLSVGADKADSANAGDNKPPAGFEALFNGQNLDGWQAAIPVDKRKDLQGDELTRTQNKANAKVLPHWTVVDGVLTNDGQGGNLATVKDYRNFVLLVDWMIEPKGDSGVYLRGIPQVQMWDSHLLDPKLKSYDRDLDKGSGGLWNNKKDNVPLKNADKSPGEWNSFRITMKGDKVTVVLNGEKVVDNVTLENVLQRTEPLPESGPLELQQHPKQDRTLGKIRFKNIYIKTLPD